MKPITKQLVIGALILALVTVVSLGIRHIIHFSDNRAGTIESPVIVETEHDRLLAELDAIVTEPDAQYADALDSTEEVPLEDYSEAKPSKGDYAKAKGSKGLQKISMGDNENLYITGEGKLWYVSEGPDGKTTKMQVQINETTGEMTVVDVGGGKSGAPQPIPMGDGYNMYITEEGQSWYVGDGSKARVEVDDNTGEITVLEQYGGEDGK
ncbi:MAG: hypothetical protein H8D56_13275 [Planctomycetes bacterium]|nr:hypothetical protein [Planctomycetota bacterium]